VGRGRLGKDGMWEEEPRNGRERGGRGVRLEGLEWREKKCSG